MVEIRLLGYQLTFGIFRSYDKCLYSIQLILLSTISVSLSLHQFYFVNLALLLYLTCLYFFFISCFTILNFLGIFYASPLQAQLILPFLFKFIFCTPCASPLTITHHFYFSILHWAKDYCLRKSFVLNDDGFNIVTSIISKNKKNIVTSSRIPLIFMHCIVFVISYPSICYFIFESFDIGCDMCTSVELCKALWSSVIIR